jgi:hypothetical protein
LDTNDWKGDYTVSKATFNNALQAVNPNISNFLVLQHDIHQQTVEDLVPYELPILLSKGYRAVTVGECLQDPSENWYRSLTDGTAAGPKDLYTPDSCRVVDPYLTDPSAKCGVQPDGTKFYCTTGNCCGPYGYWYVSLANPVFAWF